MNILVSSVYSYDSYSRGIMPDVLQTQIEKNPGAQIYYLTNSNSFNVCYFNIEKRPEICYRCKTGIKNTLKLVEGKFKHLKISEILENEDLAIAKNFFVDKDVISFDQVYENFEVGAATLSTYISRTRDRDLKNVKQPYVKELAVNALALHLAVKRFIKEHKINLVYNFNGRHEYVRAIMRAAMAGGIDCYNVERTRLKGHIDLYKNTFPHDPAYKFWLVEKYWKESLLKEEEKRARGRRFFRKQREGEGEIFPSFTGKMKEGDIPEFLKKSRKNLVVFNSSDDETVAFGELHKNPFFKDQNEGLEYLTELVGKDLPDYNLIIRMHPNLVNVDQDYVNEIKALHQRYSNIFIIEPDSSVDSYALMELADKVVTFGSTTGLEANFIRKPVILLGIGYFYYADYAYKPKSKKEISTLLPAQLSPKPLSDTLKVGYFFEKGGMKTSYYYEKKMGEAVFFKGKRVNFYSVSQRIKAKIIKIIYKYFRRWTAESK